MSEVQRPRCERAIYLVEGIKGRDLVEDEIFDVRTKCLSSL